MGWFEVDKGGLRQLLEGKDKSFIVRELVQNALDEPGVTRCGVRLDPIPGLPYVSLTVEDDAPEGFYDLSHAFTLFARTRKRTNAEMRGRFNLGEKQVLALCEDAAIKSTRGTVVFGADGERSMLKQHTEHGSVFTGKLRMTREELSECRHTVKSFLRPKGIVLTVDGEEVPYREPIRRVEAVLQTEFEDGEGQWRKSRRKTTVEIHKPQNGEKPMLYEMGLPVVELVAGDVYHYNVMQRVPLNSDRDNVSPAFLRDVRAEVLNATAELLTTEQAAERWTHEAAETDRINEGAFKTVMEKRYGKKVVSFSPGDKESNNAAAAQGYMVLGGGALSKAEWENARKFKAVESAAAQFPTAHPQFSPDGKDMTVDPKEWTCEMRRVVEFLTSLGQKLIGGVTVGIVRDKYNRFGGWFGGRSLTLNLVVLGHSFFNEFPGNLERVISFAVHEFGHAFEGNHLSEDYYRALCDLAGKCTALALAEPEFFKQYE